MGRIIGSAVAGYVVMFIVLFVLMTISWFVVGADGAFKPGVWEVTATWLFLMVAGGFVAALAGGYTTAWISPDPRAVRVLIGIVVVLGIVSVLPVLTGSATPAELPRPEALPMFEAMANGQQPTWLALLNPIIGVVGVVVGARMKSKSASNNPAAA